MATLPLLPDSPTRLVGIARLASQGEALPEGHNVEFFTLNARSLLNRAVSKRQLPFTWTINPYRGCEFACKYCYARYTHEFMEMRNGVDFDQKIYVKQHAANLLRQELRHVKRGDGIAMGAATDPYQPAERRYQVTREILEEFSRHEGFDLGIITKSNLILRDIDLLQEVSSRNHLSVTITITTLHTDLARMLEPRAPRPDLRLDTVRRLNEAGIYAGVNCAPVLPSITDSPRNLGSLVEAVAGVKAKFIHGNPLYLKPCSAAVFMPFLEEKFPHLVNSYRQRYGTNSFVTPAYRKRIAEIMQKLTQKYGMNRRDMPPRLKQVLPAPQAAQMELF